MRGPTEAQRRRRHKETKEGPTQTRRTRAILCGLLAWVLETDPSQTGGTKARREQCDGDGCVCVWCVCVCVCVCRRGGGGG